MVKLPAAALRWQDVHSHGTRVDRLPPALPCPSCLLYLDLYHTWGQHLQVLQVSPATLH